MMKKYLNFLKEQVKYSYGCVLMNFDFKNWNELLDMVDKNDIYEKEGENYGLQKKPHLTLIYGLESTVTNEDVISCFNGIDIKDFKIEIDGVSNFENPEFDVIKLTVVLNDNLKKVNSRLIKLPNTNKFDYNPHITIAFLKKGTSKKYLNPDYKYEVKNIKNVVYTTSDGKEINIYENK